MYHLVTIFVTSLRRSAGQSTVGFHNFSLRIFNLRVSNPDKLIVDVFLTRCRISMCQGLGQQKHDDISEIDRKPFYRKHYDAVSNMANICYSHNRYQTRACIRQATTSRKFSRRWSKDPRPQPQTFSRCVSMTITR